MINENLLSSTRSSLNENVRVTSSIRSLREKFEIKIYIKREEKIKRIMTTITNDMISRAREANARTTLSTRKNIIAIKRRSNIVIFRVKTKKNKRILKANNF